jgi:hypothetical protein
MTRAVLAILTIVLASAGCTTTMTSPTPAADSDLLLREFTSLLIPGGSASREFATTVAGTVTVTVTSTTPAGVAIGVGVGIPRSNGSCALAAAVEAPAGAGAQISMTADAGTLCAKVYDPGTLEAPLPFTISILRP